MIVLKDSKVIAEGLSGQIHYALGVAAALKHRLFGVNTVVTALLDGHHNAGSLHASGYAADLRTHDLSPTEAISWREAIAAELDALGFDVVFEGVGATGATTGDHLHLEFDPKQGEHFWHILP